MGTGTGMTDTMSNIFSILLVEDSKTQALKVQYILEQQNYRVKIASNGMEGLSYLEEEPFPIVITDWVMPEMDGFEFCQAIRRKEFENYVYIILLTAKDSKDDIIAGLQAGADDYLIKPVDPAELAARVNTAKRVLSLESSLRTRNKEIALLTLTVSMLSITDPLTQTYNRRYLNDLLPQILREAFEENRQLSIIICDIDHFKYVNDAYGHLAGDYVLKEFSKCIKSDIRQGEDWMVRYGGEEFLIVLPDAGIEYAKEVAERHRRNVENAVIIHEDTQIKITSSFGVASVRPTEEGRQVNADSLIAAADKCLYEAKEKGRNRCFSVILG